MMRISRLWFAVLVVAALTFSTTVSADSWSFPATIKTQPERHEYITIHRIRGARKDQQYPDYSIEISRLIDLQCPC